MPSALHTSICELYESHALTPAQIAEQLGIEEVLVVSTLLQFSPSFKKNSKNSETPLISDQETQEFLSAYKSIARYTDDDNLKERALRNLINLGLKVQDGLGANDPRKLLQAAGGAGNIMDMNMIIRRAREAKAKVIDVETVEPNQLEANVAHS